MTCRRCDISRPTLRKWVKRYQEQGIDGLRTKSKRPNRSPGRKVTEQHEAWILELRHERRLGVRRIQHELERLYELHLSIDSIDKVLKRHGVPPLKRISSSIKQSKRYEKAIPGERIQLDTCQIGRNIIQYTAIDDCSRFLVAVLYTERNAAHTIDFIELVLDALVVPIQRIQTDRGTEFIAYDVLDFLHERSIKFRPNRPGAPHLNGKVERVQRTVKDEFFSSIEVRDLDLQSLNDALGGWVMYYNYQRVHGAIKTTPAARLAERSPGAPWWHEVEDAYDIKQERQRLHDWKIRAR